MALYKKSTAPFFVYAVGYKIKNIDLLFQEEIIMPNSSKIVSETSDFIQREIDFNLSILVSKKLLKEGLITEMEYNEIDTILERKYSPFLSAFISKNP